MSDTVLDKLTVNGVSYIREGAQQPAASPGKRAVVVVDRGWIFAGDVSMSEDGKIVLSRAVHVLSWSSGGFAGLVADPKKSGAKLFSMTAPVHIPVDSEIFRVPVGDAWGL